MGRIILGNKRRERFGVGHMSFVERERACALHYTLARDEYVYRRIEVIGCVSYYVGVDSLVYRSYTLGFEL